MTPAKRNPLATPPGASSLSTEEWALIEEALRAYQHHSAFVALYQKVTRLSTEQERRHSTVIRHPSL